MTSSRKPVRQAARKRRHSFHRVKTGRTYDVAETAELLGVHSNTVRQWLKLGLEPLDSCRPLLIHGSVLKAFLAKRQNDRRAKCGPGEFYCFRCKAPRKPWEGLVDVVDHGPNVVRLVALCEVCETAMHRTSSRPKLKATLEGIAQSELAPERISDRQTAS